MPDYVIRGGATYRVFSDHLGSPRVAVNVANATDMPLNVQYEAFGATSGSGAGWIPQGFAAGIYDTDTGFVRFGARDYDPTTGRWTAKDSPFSLRGETNMYSYLGQDPVNATDSTGAYMDDECSQKVARGCREGCQGVCGGFLDEACFQACMFSNRLLENMSPGSICDNEPWQTQRRCVRQAKAVYDACYQAGGLIHECQAVELAYYDACMHAAISGRGQAQ